MSHATKKIAAKILENKTVLAIFIFIFLVYILSSFDVCWFPGGPQDKGFVFGSDWTEHLHSSEGWTVYYQTGAFYEGRSWLSKDSPPEYSVDSVKIGEYYYAIAEPVTAGLLLPFYAFGRLLLGAGVLMRSVIVGMILFTCVSALLVRKISLQLNQSQITANLTAVLFAFCTMAFSYSRLLYPQPVVTLLMLVTLVFLFNYKKNLDLKNLFCAALFYAITVFSFNAFIVTAPFFGYFLLKTRLITQRKQLLTALLGSLPILVLFLLWNNVTTGNILMTPRQIVHPSMAFDIFYVDAGSTWLNLGGVFGSLFSPVGIFFVSPILFASVICFSTFYAKRKDETLLLVSIITIFWLFISFMNLGGNVGRDFWVGGWANIARYMYVPSTLLIIIASGIFDKINETRNLFGAWFVSLIIIIGSLANLSYGVRHDFMVGLLKDFPSTSLLIWPNQLESVELWLLIVAIVLGSLIYPIYLYRSPPSYLRSEK